MLAITASSIGSLDALEVTDLPLPEPGPGEVRVRVCASAVNPADLKVLEGQFFGRFLHSVKPPVVMGYDLSGVIDAVGSGVDDLAVGDAVWGHQQYEGATVHGCFAEATVIAAGAVAPVPEGVDHATAAASATAGLTALQALRDKAGLSGGRALIIGASGGVGSIAVGVAGRLGAEVSAVCSTHAVDLVRDLGAVRVIDRKAEDPLASGGPYEAVFDTPAVHSYGAVRHLLAPGGAFVTTVPGLGLALGKLQALVTGRRCEFVVVHSRRADLELLGGWLVDGLEVPIDSRYPVKDVARALQALQKGGRTGRIVVDVEGGW